MMRQYNSIVEPLLERVQREPEAQAMVFIGDDGTETEVSVGRLHREATAYARSLQALGLGPGDIVTIALPHSIGLIAAFWGAMYIGIIPTIFPYLVPRPDADTFKKQVRTLTENAGAKAIITDSKEAELSTLLADLGCQVLHVRQIKCEDGDPIDLSPNMYTCNEQIAFLQYTSGTTGLRKGVRLSHRALLNFIPAFVEALDINSSDVVVNWLPLYHEYGLFAGVVLPMFVGIPTVLMSPFKWVRSPKTWLRAVHTYRGTLCWTTNSAYHHLSRAVRDRDLAGVDMSSLRALVSGAEPVLHQSHQMFLKRFADYGISEATLLSGYGVAENTMAVTVNPPGRVVPVEWIDVHELQINKRVVPLPAQAPGSLATVSCGVPVAGGEIRIIDEEGQPLPERRVGEIIIRTNALFSGYHGQPELTAQVMKDDWFYTGDLGYMAGGHLYICGRKKDMIIVAGRNVYPEDLEAIANTVPGIYSDRAVAFGVFDEQLGSEKIVMVCDLKRKVGDAEKIDIERELRRRVHQELDITLGEVHLVKKGWVVKTINGKIARAANREKYKAMKDEVHT